jgi:copper chaperone CopZ
MQSTAQITKIELQANGLTCSMCNKAIYKSLQTISYVSKIETDINKNLFTVYMNDSAKINIDDFKKKVEGAGYSIARLYLYQNLEQIDIKNDAHIQVSDTYYHFLNVKEQRLNGLVKMQVLDKGFTTAKENKQNNRYTKLECYQTGYMENCCSGKPVAAVKTRIYHVTL